MHRNPDNIAKIIVDSYEQGVRAINLVNDDALIEGFEIALNSGCNMDVIATIGKSEVDYMAPNYDVAKEVDWDEDIELFSKFKTPIMLIDEFITDGYDWNLNNEILEAINDTDSLAGISTSFPNKTTEQLANNIDLDLFDFYMIPLNKLAYMMDLPSFLENEREEFKQKVLKLDKKIIASRVLAAGILTPKEAFSFLDDFGLADLITVGVANEKEVKEDFTALKEL
ncbi:MAG: hypothetical protein Q4P18_05300 [Methanobrevibacter sp.]|nr:hypothetical protein [Methanobrevibacter sp.]MDO5848929.1 hypothetical protein [Methanobrevibacter sp.]